MIYGAITLIIILFLFTETIQYLVYITGSSSAPVIHQNVPKYTRWNIIYNIIILDLYRIYIEQQHQNIR